MVSIISPLRKMRCPHQVNAMSEQGTPKQSYQPPELIRYGRIEDLTQMPKKDDGGGYSNKWPGAADGQKSKVI